ncbi:MAG TPA: cytochrome C [Rhodanobacteraceae bacterium]|nr:cytochrome C [Rhodanobacteraceae bacterium]
MKTAILLGLPALLLAMTAAAAAPAKGAGDTSIARGRHLVQLGGCNDCHTPGWSEHGGSAPKTLLLTGGGLAFQGPWGTTYPINLRLQVQEMDAKTWVKSVRTTRARPLMPWWTFRYLSDADITAMYNYIHALGPAGKPAPAWVPPGGKATPPYMKLVMPAAMHKSAGQKTARASGQH